MDSSQATLNHPTSRVVRCCLAAIVLTGCVRLFGWDIHAPGILSRRFAETVQPVPERIALYLAPELLNYQSQDRGSRTADPQTYHIGEALGPVLVEAFQEGFHEFIFLETEPTRAILARYAIPRVAVVRVKRFKNRVTWRGQKVTLVTETRVFDSELKPLSRFESVGTSEAKKVFAKKGGPEVNLNAAIESNVLAILQNLQGWKP